MENIPTAQHRISETGFTYDKRHIDSQQIFIIIMLRFREFLWFAEGLHVSVKVLQDCKS